MSTLLIRSSLNASLRPALLTALTALTIAVIVASLSAQLLLRRMAGDPTYREHVYTTELIVRGSTRSLLDDG